MRKMFSATLLILSINFVLYAQEPYIRLQNLDNIWMEYSDLKGEKLTIIDFWATWCQPCLRSIPELNAIYTEFSEQGLSLVGISIDGPRNQSKLKPFVYSMGVKYPILRDINSEFMSEMNVSSVPSLLIFNSEGEQVFIHEGFRPGDELLIREKIAELLN